MAAYPSSIASTFFVLKTFSSSSSCNNSTKKSNNFSQHLSNYMNYGKRANMKSILKIKSQAQALGTNESGVNPTLESVPAKSLEQYLEGRLIKGGHVFQQNFLIRSFEIDRLDHKVSMKAIMNYLQDAVVNCSKKRGLTVGTHFGTTPEMKKRDLALVFRSMHIEVDRCPSWNDVVQVSHWMYTAGRTGIRFDWIINDIKTGEALVRASCVAVMMNKITRKACKLPKEVEEELKPYLTKDFERIVEDRERISSPKVDEMDHIQTGLTPGWHDLDFNSHVNNSKYLDWILESVPYSFMRNQELSAINIEYRKECLKDDEIQSLSRVVTDHKTNLSMNCQGFELEHMLRLESGTEVLRARTTWRPKLSVTWDKQGPIINGKPSSQKEH